MKKEDLQRCYDLLFMYCVKINTGNLDKGEPYAPRSEKIEDALERWARILREEEDTVVGMRQTLPHNTIANDLKDIEKAVDQIDECFSKWTDVEKRKTLYPAVYELLYHNFMHQIIVESDGIGQRDELRVLNVEEALETLRDYRSNPGAWEREWDLFRAVKNEAEEFVKCELDPNSDDVGISIMRGEFRNKRNFGVETTSLGGQFNQGEFVVFYLNPTDRIPAIVAGIYADDLNGCSYKLYTQDGVDLTINMCKIFKWPSDRTLTREQAITMKGYLQNR